MRALFGEQVLGGPWRVVRDADPVARSIFHRHYSRYIYRDGRDPKKFVGPGESMILVTWEDDALFVWRRFISADGQRGVNCAVFRNEGSILSSYLILEAEKMAAVRWPGERFFTYVNPRKIRSTNPGFCFKQAGWRPCGVTMRRSYLILEKTT